MSYRIRSLKDLRITPRIYFFDANIWLYFMQGECLSLNKYAIPDYQRPYHERYHTLVTRLFETVGAQVALPALLVSEVVNAFIRRFAMPANLRLLGYSDQQARNANPKYHYRDNPQSNYSEMMSLLVSQFRSFFDAGLVLPCDLNFNESSCAAAILDNFSKMNRTDFNDYCYYELCAEHRWPLITDDEDLCFPDIEIYTYNSKLLNKAGVK